MAINREGERLQGFPASETVGLVNLHDHRTHYDLSGPDGRTLASEELPALRALRGEDVHQEEMPLQGKSAASDVRSIITNASPLRDAGGQIEAGRRRRGA